MGEIRKYWFSRLIIDESPKKNVHNLIFSKALKLFTHGMGCFGTGLGMLFHLYKGLLVTHELFEKIEKNSSKITACSL